MHGIGLGGTRRICGRRALARRARAAAAPVLLWPLAACPANRWPLHPPAALPLGCPTPRPHCCCCCAEPLRLARLCHAAGRPAATPLSLSSAAPLPLLLLSPQARGLGSAARYRHLAVASACSPAPRLKERHAKQSLCHCPFSFVVSARHDAVHNPPGRDQPFRRVAGSAIKSPIARTHPTLNRAGQAPIASP